MAFKRHIHPAEIPPKITATSDLSAASGSAPIYPQPANSSDAQWAGAQVGGMTLRQHYAGLALQGILANPDRLFDPDDAAREAMIHADSMLKRTKKLN